MTLVYTLDRLNEVREILVDLIKVKAQDALYWPPQKLEDLENLKAWTDRMLKDQ